MTQGRRGKSREVCEDIRENVNGKGRRRVKLILIFGVKGVYIRILQW